MSNLAQRHTAKRTASQNPPIAKEINAATQSLHTELNRLITERLPLGLPPHASSPSRYAAGLRRFSIIFFAFEHAFSIVAENASKSQTDDHRRAVSRWVADLAPSGMRRTDRLRADLEHLHLLGHGGMPPAYGEVTLDKLMVDVVQKPHLLVAYSWVMYMAIFSGGRWIRQQLASAGSAFWLDFDEAASVHIDPLPGFSFLSFDTDDDGEGLKSAFKEHLTAADGLLTAEERQEVVATGEDVFRQCIQIVEQIDRDVWWQEGSAGGPLAIIIIALGVLYLAWLLYTGQSLLLD